MNKEINYEDILNSLKVLELPILVSLKDINTKYRDLAKKYHPDFYKDKNKMAEINNAYNILKEYIYEYKFSFSKEEYLRQNPRKYHESRFRF